MTPGDVVEVAVPLTVTAEGKNLKGKVVFDSPAVDLTDPALGGKLSLTYKIAPFDTDTVTEGIQPETGVTYSGPDALVSFVAISDGIFAVDGYATFTLAATATQAEADAANTAIDNVAFTVKQDARPPVLT